MLFKRGGKDCNRFFAGANEIALLYLIDGNEVDVNGHTVGAASELFVEKLGQALGGGGGVIFACNEGVFKGNAPRRLFVIIAAGVKQLVNRPAAIDGHNVGAGVIVGGVKGYGQGNGKRLLCQLTDARDDSAGGKGNVAVADVQTVGMPHQT